MRARSFFLLFLVGCAFVGVYCDSAAKKVTAPSSGAGRRVELFHSQKDLRELSRQRDELRFLLHFNYSRPGDAVRLKNIEADVEALQSTVNELRRLLAAEGQ